MFGHEIGTPDSNKEATSGRISFFFSSDMPSEYFKEQGNKGVTLHQDSANFHIKRAVKIEFETYLTNF